MFGFDVDAYATQSAVAALQLQGSLKVSWIIEHDLYRIAAEILYVVFCWGLLDMAVKHHAAKVRGVEGPKQYPPGYFIALIAQLLPLIITGFVRGDVFLIGTRVGTFFMVLLAYALVHSKNGTFDSPRQKFWIMFWFAVTIIGPTVWMKEESVRTFVEVWQTWIAWSTIVLMFGLLVFGQHVTAKELFKHFMDGNYTFKRFSLQIDRFAIFGLQAIHYFVVFGWQDPVFWQGVMGALGALWVIIWAMIGMFFGVFRRRPVTA